ncbi:MAG TPA: sigma-70 family RNA polymerase sigma factor [Candidatus Limnocylindria bacterium]|nr:sigma-70 family RNA polymerase sigma factor [Candidatus Limnocylindria bacterium]
MAPEPVLLTPPGDGADRALIRDLAAGNITALELLYDKYRVLAYSIAFRVTGDWAAAEDVLQEAFLALWRNPTAYEPERGSLKTWFLTIVRHRAIDANRRRHVTSELPNLDNPLPAGLSIPDIWPDVSARLDAEVARAALSELSAVQREAIELAYFGGLTHVAIALRTQVPVGTAKSRIRLGLATLRRVLVDVTPDTGRAYEMSPRDRIRSVVARSL